MTQQVAPRRCQMNSRGVPVEWRDWFRQHVAWRRAEGDAHASVNQLLLALVHGYAFTASPVSAEIRASISSSFSIYGSFFFSNSSGNWRSSHWLMTSAI